MTYTTNNRNIANLLRYINTHEGATKLELAENLNLSPASLTKISKNLFLKIFCMKKKKLKITAKELTFL